MAKEFLTKYEYQTGDQEKYSTLYTWRLKNWSQLFDSTYMRGVASTYFGLDGTRGKCCKVRLSPESGYSSSKELGIEFSDTKGVELIDITFRVGNAVSKSIQYGRPFQTYYTHRLDCSFSKDRSHQTLKMSPSPLAHRLPIVGPDANNEVVIVIEITILKLVDSFSCPYPTTLQPVLLPKSEPSQLPKAKSPRNILQNFKLMFDRKAFCDVSLVLGEKTFYAHKAVLAAQSTVFQAMFSNDMKEQRDSKVEISDTNVEIFEQFLKYLYGEEITKLQDMVEEMIVIADFYDVPDLKNQCESLMMASLTKNKVIGYVILADKLNCQKLKNAALYLIRNSAIFTGEALLNNDVAKIVCLKKILSQNRQ